MPKQLSLDGHSLTLDDVAGVALSGDWQVALAAEARQNMAQSRDWVEQLIARGQPVYGLNTGFGVFADRHISKDDT